MSDERDKNIDPSSALNEVENILKGDERDKLLRITVQLRTAVEIGLLLDGSRIWNQFQQTNSDDSKEMAQMLFSGINPLQNSNIPYNPTTGRTVEAVPDEGLLSVLADKFPTIKEITKIKKADNFENLLNEDYEVRLSFRELQAFGNYLLREMLEGEDYLAHFDEANYPFLHSKEFREAGVQLTRTLIDSFFELRRAFIISGGADPREVSEALKKKLVQLPQNDQSNEPNNH